MPDSPLLRITGKGGEGYFMFFNKALLRDPLSGELPPDAMLLLGMRLHKGLSVTVALGTAEADLNLLGVIDPLELQTSFGSLDLEKTLSTGEGVGVQGAIAGTFTPALAVEVPPGVKVKVSKEFRFSASGRIVMPPLGPPPGFVWVNDLDYDKLW